MWANIHLIGPNPDLVTQVERQLLYVIRNTFFKYYELAQGEGASRPVGQETRSQGTLYIYVDRTLTASPSACPRFRNDRGAPWFTYRNGHIFGWGLRWFQLCASSSQRQHLYGRDLFRFSLRVFSVVLGHCSSWNTETSQFLSLMSWHTDSDMSVSLNWNAWFVVDNERDSQLRNIFHRKRQNWVE